MIYVHWRKLTMSFGADFRRNQDLARRNRAGTRMCVSACLRSLLLANARMHQFTVNSGLRASAFEISGVRAFRGGCASPTML